jgi:hypothetical protein
MAQIQVPKLFAAAALGPPAASISVTKLFVMVVYDPTTPAPGVTPPRKRVLGQIRYGDLAPATVFAPINITLPSISGTPDQGETLTADYGTWTGNP